MALTKTDRKYIARGLAVFVPIAVLAALLPPAWGGPLIILAICGALAGLIVLVLIDYRQQWNLSWRQAIGHAVATVAAFGLVATVAAVVSLHRDTVLPLLMVIGFYALLFGVGVVLIYIVVRVIRAAWKGP